MNHEEQVILYAANRLDQTDRAAFEVHLAECMDCQEELKLWSAVSEEINASSAAVTAPPYLAESALAGNSPSFPTTALISTCASIVEIAVIPGPS